MRRSLRIPRSSWIFRLRFYCGLEEKLREFDRGSQAQESLRKPCPTELLILIKISSLRCNCRHSFVPRRGSLVLVRRAQHHIFPPWRGSQLQSNRHAIFRKTGGNRNRRNPPHIEWPRVAQYHQLGWPQIVWIFL